MSSTKLIGPHKITTFCGTTDIDEFNQAMQSMSAISSVNWSAFYTKYLQAECEKNLGNGIAHFRLIYRHSSDYGLEPRHSLWRARSRSADILLADYEQFVQEYSYFQDSWVYHEIATLIRTKLRNDPPVNMQATYSRN